MPTDPANVAPSSEAAWLDRAKELAPLGHLAVVHGRPAPGPLLWTAVCCRRLGRCGRMRRE